MGSNHAANAVRLHRGTDPSGQFCVGPSCERGLYSQGMTTSLHSCFTRGPWPDLSSFGITLVEREIVLLKQNRKTATYGPPRESFDEEMAALKMTKEVMSALNEPTFIDIVSESVLWHTDLHMVVISPLFIQTRFPEFLPVSEDFALGTTNLPKLPENYSELDADDKEYAQHKLKEAKLAKGWELSSGSENNQAYKALRIPSFLRELFVRSGEVSEEGVLPLRACLTELSKTWNDLGFTTQCPASFSEDKVQRHEQKLQEYRDYHEVHELARKILGTGSEGWVTPQADFAAKQQQNKELLQEFMRRSDEYGKTPEKIWEIWPYRERS